MRIVDVNVLLHASNTRSQEHAVARGWLNDALSGSAAVGFAWIALLGFIRVSTLTSGYSQPLSPQQALQSVESWLRAPAAQVIDPGKGHAAILGNLLQQVGTAGNLTTDAHLAALALEHRGTVITFDRDFARFPGVRWQFPTLPAGGIA